jgi:alpha-amylase
MNGVMMQYFHWYTPDDGSLWKEIQQNAKDLASAGITALWIPPPYKGAAGGMDVGYSVYDMFDLGEFDQKSSVRTKYGTREDLEKATWLAREAGLQIYVDVVMNHRMGGDHEEEFTAIPYSNDNRHEQVGEPRTIKCHTHFSFPGRGKAHSDFEWHWWHFTAADYDLNDPEFNAVYLFENKKFDERVDREKGSFDYLMGCDIDVFHPEVQAEFDRWGAWYHDHIGLDGVRFDAVKHVEAGFFAHWLQNLRKHAKNRVFAVGEYWSYDVEALHAFIEATGGDVHLFDAPLLNNFADASKAGNNFDMRTIFDNSLVKNEPGLAVTIVSNHDAQPLQQLENVVEAWFTPIAYALTMLRRDGYPCLFYADYYGATYKDVGKDGNEHEITVPSHRFLLDKFLQCRRDFAYGEQCDFFDHGSCIGWTRTGDGEHPGGMAVLVSTGDAGSKRMKTNVPNQNYRDVTEHLEQTIMSDENGEAEFCCPAGSLSVWIPC